MCSVFVNSIRHIANPYHQHVFGISARRLAVLYIDEIVRTLPTTNFPETLIENIREVCSKNSNLQLREVSE